MARVLLSPASRSSMSPTSTSAMSPSETMLEKPILRSTAQSITAEAMAPDCDRKASLPAAGAIWAKLALSADAGNEHAEGVRPDDAQQMGPGRIQHLLAQAALARQARGQNHRGAGAALAEFGDDARHRGGGCCNDRKIRCGRQRRDIREAGKAVDRIVLRIDRPDRALEAGVAHVLGDEQAYRAFAR